VGLTHPPVQQGNTVDPGARTFFGDWLKVRTP